MQNKKVIVSVSFFIVIFFVVFIFIFLRKRGIFNLNDSLKNVPASDQSIYDKAIEKISLEDCDKIKNEELKNTCKYTIGDLDLYLKAISQYNPALCQNIQENSRKEACLTVITSGVDDLKKNNPQYLANIYSSTHNEEAISEYESLLNINPNDIDSLISLSLAYSEKGLKEQEKGGSQASFVEKALILIEKAKLIEPNNSDIYRALGYANEIKPDYVEALNAYSKAIELSDNNILAYAGKGHTYRLMGALENAVNEFNKAAKLDTKKEYVHIYTNLCNLESSRSNYDEAIKNCKIVIEKKDTDPVFQSNTYQIMAEISLGNKNNVQARNFLISAKALTPNDPNLYVIFAKLNLYDGKYEESEIDARKAIELSPIKAIGYLSLSHALYMQEKYSDSIEAAEKGLNLIKDDVSLLASNKSAVGRDLYYSIANNYRQMNNKEKQNEFEKKAEDFFNQLLK